MSSATPPGGEDEDDWIERVVAVAARLGFNEVRVRWKLMHLQQWWASRKAAAADHVEHARYQNKVCPWCTALNGRDDASCAACHEALPSHRWQVLARLGLVADFGWTVSSVLGTLNLLVFARLCAEAPAASLVQVPVGVLVRHGGLVPDLVVLGGEWWRLGTAIFLHVGVWHLGFNVMALAQVGPLVEKAFGRARMLFLYMATGLVASLGSVGMGGYGVSVGASGAIMGLIGAAAAYGHRVGSRAGLALRDQLLTWAVVVFLLGGFLGADNAAHGFGLAAGGLCGALLEPRFLQRRQLEWFEQGCAVLGTTAMVAAVWLCLFPLQSALAQGLIRAWGG